MFIGSLALVATPRSAEANFSNNTAFATVSCTSTGVAAQPAQTANRYWGNNLTSAVSNAVASGISAYAGTDVPYLAGNSSNWDVQIQDFQPSDGYCGTADWCPDGPDANTSCVGGRSGATSSLVAAPHNAQGMWS